MTVKKILTEPDPFLRQKSQTVEKVDDDMRQLMDDMLDTMYNAQGIGLAAIQIGTPKRVIVIDLLKLTENKEPGLLALKFVEIIGEDEMYELDPETVYFIVHILNQANLKRFRNKVLTAALPLRS